MTSFIFYLNFKLLSSKYESLMCPENSSKRHVGQSIFYARARLYLLILILVNLSPGDSLSKTFCYSLSIVSYFELSVLFCFKNRLLKGNLNILYCKAFQVGWSV